MENIAVADMVTTYHVAAFRPKTSNFPRPSLPGWLGSAGTNEETVVETYYRAQLAPRISLQPDLQYIATPSGIYRDAMAIGTRMQIRW